MFKWLKNFFAVPYDKPETYSKIPVVGEIWILKQFISEECEHIRQRGVRIQMVGLHIVTYSFNGSKYFQNCDMDLNGFLYCYEFKGA